MDKEQPHIAREFRVNRRANILHHEGFDGWLNPGTVLRPTDKVRFEGKRRAFLMEVKADARLIFLRRPARDVMRIERDRDTLGQQSSRAGGVAPRTLSRMIFSKTIVLRLPLKIGVHMMDNRRI